MKLCLFLLGVLVGLKFTSGQDLYFTLNGNQILNHSLVAMENIGEGDAGLICVTSRRPCCKTNFHGDWYYPDGSLVSVRASGDSFYRNRNNNGGVVLNRRNNANLPNGKYKCYIPGANGRLVEMVVGIYSILAYPTLVSHPSSVLNAVPGTTVTFTVRARDAVAYSWVYNSDYHLQSTARHRGVKTNILVITNVQESDEGRYHCVVEKELSVSSWAAILSVMDPPTIDVQPVSVPNLIKGQDASFTVQASGTDLTYNWQFANGSQLQNILDYRGMDMPTLTILQVARKDVELYRCAVSNPAGTVYSVTVNITLLDPPQIVVQPEDMLNLQLGQTVNFTLLATGHALTYQWQFANGSALPNTTDYEGVDTPTFTIKNVRMEHVGEYRCAVSNGAGTVYSSSVNLTIVAVPDISSLNATPEITSVLLTWTPTTPPNTTTTFQVRYYHLSFPEREVRVGVANPSYQAVGLLPRGRYHFEVRQVTDIGVGGAESVDVRLTENIPAVETVNLTMVNNTAISVSWEPLSSLPGWNISFYEVHSRTLTSSTPSHPLYAHTARTTNGDEASLVLVHGDLLAGGDVELVIEVNGVLDVGVEGVGTVEGERAVKNVTLELETSLFQIILGPTDYCISWTDEKTAAVRRDIHAALARVISGYCHCNFSADSIHPGVFSCRQSSNSVTYRSSISGLNAKQTVAHIEHWVRAGAASMLVRSFFWDVYNIQDCSIRISSMSDPECLANEQGSTPAPRTLVTSDPSVINCVSRCMAESGSSRICETDP